MHVLCLDKPGHPRPVTGKTIWELGPPLRPGCQYATYLQTKADFTEVPTDATKRWPVSKDYKSDYALIGSMCGKGVLLVDRAASQLPAHPLPTLDPSREMHSIPPNFLVRASTCAIWNGSCETSLCTQLDGNLGPLRSEAQPRDQHCVVASAFRRRKSSQLSDGE